MRDDDCFMQNSHAQQKYNRSSELNYNINDAKEWVIMLYVYLQLYCLASNRTFLYRFGF